MKQIKCCVCGNDTPPKRTNQNPAYCSRDCRLKKDIQVDPATGCWNWTGKLTWVGYGQFSWCGKVQPAHRHAYLEWVGAIPEGHVVRHKCDNRRCCQPKHLETGTQAENIQDMLARNSKVRKLDRATVLAILADTGTAVALAKKYGVTVSQAGGIKRGSCYTDITGLPPRYSIVRKVRGVVLTHQGKTMTLREWADEIGLTVHGVHHRWIRGCSVEETLSPKTIGRGGRPRKGSPE